MGMDGGCGGWMGAAGSVPLCNRVPFAPGMCGVGGCEQRRLGRGVRPGMSPVGCGRSLELGGGGREGGGSLWGCGCWRFHICSRCYLPANASGRRSVAVLVCGCSRLPALWFRGGGDAAVPASGWGGVTTRPAPLPHCRTPCAPPPPLVVPPQPPGLHAPHPHCAARFCCTLGAACCDAPPALLPPQPAISRGGDACGHVRGVAECHRPPPLPSGAATANAGSVRDPLPGAAGTGAAPPPPSPRISSCNAEELPNSSVPPLRPIGAAMGSEGWGGWQWGHRGGGKAAGSCWGILRDPSLLRGCPRCPTLLPPPHGRGGLGPMAPLSFPEGGLGGGWSPLRRSAAASKWLRAAEPRGWGGRGAAFC